MSVVNGFMIVLMLLLLMYSFCRLIIRRLLLMLIPVFAQIFSISVALLCFINDLEALQLVETGYVLLGILPPAVFLIADYSKMVRRVKNYGIYSGLIGKPSKKIRHMQNLPLLDINPPAGEKQIPEIIKELNGLPDEIKRNIEKCLIQAHSLICEEDYTGAVNIYSVLAKAISSSYMLHYNSAWIYSKLGRYEEAAEAYNNALASKCGTDTEKQDIYYNIGNTYYMLNEFEKAARCFEKAFEINRSNPLIAENFAFSCIRLGNVSKGIRLLTETAALECNYRAHFIAGKLLHDIGKSQEAENELKRCLNLQHDSIEAQHELGKLLLEQNKQGEALDIYDEIIRLEPRDYTALFARANICVKLNRWKEAVTGYKKAIKIKPDSFRCYYNMAVALEECGEQDAAAKAYRKVIEISPDFIDAYNNLGIVLSLTGRNEQALEVYKEAIRRNPQDYRVYFNMGMSFYEAGKFPEAADAFRNALDIREEELEIYYYLAAALMEMRHYDDAVKAYKCALKIKPKDEEIYYNIASIYALLGRYDVSEANLRKAIEINSDIRNDARIDRVFDGMRSRNDFKELVS